MRWLRRTVLFFAGLAIVFAAIWYWALHTNSGARWVWAQAQSASDGRLHAGAVDGDLAGGLSLLQPGFDSDGFAVELNALHIRIDVDLFPRQVEILSLELDSVGVRLSDSEADPQPNEDSPPIGDLRLPVRLVFSDVEATDIRLTRDAEQLVAISRIALAGEWHEDIVIHSLQAAIENIALAAEGAGTPDEYRYSASATSQDTQFGDLVATIEGNGSLEYLLASSLRVDGEGLEAVGSAELSWSAGVEGSAAVDLAMLDLSRLVEEWPVDHPLNGQIRLHAVDERVAITETVVRVTDLPATAELNLELDRTSGEISGEVGWSAVAWPIDTPAVTSDAGNVQLKGSLDAWHLTGTIDVGTEQMPDGRFTLEGSGDRDSAVARIDEGRAFGGTVSGNVAYRWRDEHPWSAALDLVGVQTAALMPDWPGSVSGNVQARGSSRPFTISAQLEEIEGTLRDSPLRANGGVEYDGHLVACDNLHLDHGYAHLQLNGSTQDENGLQFLLRVIELSDYTDQVAGGFNAEGRVSGLQKQLSITAISERLEIANQALEEVSLSLDYSDSAQDAVLAGSYLGTGFGLSLSGAFADWQQPHNSTWSGIVDALEIDLAGAQSFQLREAAGLTVSTRQLSLQDFCIDDAAGAALCVEFASKPGGALNLSAELTDLPAMISEHFVDHSLNLTQSVSGTIDWRRSRNGETQGQANLNIAAGQVSSANDPDLVLQTGAGNLGFTVRNQRLLAGDLFVPLPDVGQVDAEFAVIDVRQGIDSEVTGEANIKMSQIGIIADFSPVIDSIGGTLESSFSLAGSVGAPELTGTLKVDNGEILYAPIGLHLREIDLDGSLQENRSFQLSGDFQAGDGSGHIVSSADYGSAHQSGLRFRVQGSDLQLVNVPNLQAVIAPDFEITYDQQQLGINGSVDITRMRIAPTNLADGRVNESEDVVIVAGELPDPRAEADNEQRIEYHGNLDVTLGDSVVVDLDVARANLGGAVSFAWQGDALPVADGRIGIDGSIEAFGQVLEVTEGIINFPSVSANNPNVRIRAEREIYGNSQVKRAGILVDGYVDRPTIEPYTVPMTTEERALTLLVTGSDFDYEQGVGAVDFGTYIAPRLFVSYGIGIFDQDNVISARYDLSSGFGIKASSGSKESGFDLNYRFEN